MRFIVKYFPEIIVKSRTVRKQFNKLLTDNLRRQLKQVDRQIIITNGWDKIVVESSLPTEKKSLLISVLATTPGVGQFLSVESFELTSFDEIGATVLDLFKPLIDDKYFVVRAKRSGKHDFNSHQIEQEVGGYLLENANARGVKLKNPDYTVKLEIRDNFIYAIKDEYKGLGGFPLGSMQPVLSLLSGGFDSTVASFETIRRGMSTHFIFFNLGGHAHEVAVKEVAYYIWQKYSSTSPVKFISVPFMDVVAEMLQSVPASYRGVVLKRMMMRASSRVAEKLKLGALVTGEAVGQVASQTVPNLGLIDEVADLMVIRPLIVSDKEKIIATSRLIGTFEFAESIPEYCGIISTKPVTRGTRERTVAAEATFDFSVLDKAVDAAIITPIEHLDRVAEDAPEVEVLSVPIYQSKVIDIRHPDEIDNAPLVLETNEVRCIPFYKLHKAQLEMDKTQHYMLFCERGVMSKLHAAHMKAEGFQNVSVYRGRI